MPPGGTLALWVGRRLPPTPGGDSSPLLPEGVRGPAIHWRKTGAEEKQAVGPGCSHRPLERNLPALGIGLLPALHRLLASRCFE